MPPTRSSTPSRAHCYSWPRYTRTPHRFLVDCPEGPARCGADQLRGPVAGHLGGRKLRSIRRSARRKGADKAEDCLAEGEDAGIAGPAEGYRGSRCGWCRAGSDRGPLLQTLVTYASGRCARRTPRRAERRIPQHPVFLPRRPAVPLLRQGLVLALIRRRPVSVRWRCRCGRWGCWSAGRATTGQRSP